MRFFFWRVSAADACYKEPRQPEGAQLPRHTIAAAARDQTQVMLAAKPSEHLTSARDELW